MSPTFFAVSLAVGGGSSSDSVSVSLSSSDSEAGGGATGTARGSGREVQFSAGFGVPPFNMLFRLGGLAASGATNPAFSKAEVKARTLFTGCTLAGIGPGRCCGCGIFGWDICLTTCCGGGCDKTGCVAERLI
jgi:hypothetical protein